MHGGIRWLSRCTTQLAKQMTSMHAHAPRSMSARRAYWTQGQAVTAPLASYEPPPRSPEEQQEIVEKELWDFWNRTRPSPTQQNARRVALKKIRMLVEKFAAKKGLMHPYERINVVRYGSNRIGVDRQESEIDLVLLDPKRPQGFKPGIMYEKVPNIMYDVQELSRHLHGCKQVQAIPKARVPIVRGVICDEEHPAMKTPFSICVNARNGLYNSQLLGAYVELDERVGPLIVILKEWARKSGLDKPELNIRNGRKGRVIAPTRPFSSYTITLMAVAFLQHVRLLPNLQQPFVGKVETTPGKDVTTAQYRFSRPCDDTGDAPVVYWSVDVNHPYDHKRMPSDVRFLDPHTDSMQNWIAERNLQLERKGGQPTLVSLLNGFFKFYAEFDYALSAISVRDGGVVSRLRRPGYRPPERLFAEVSRDLRDAGRAGGGEGNADRLDRSAPPHVDVAPRERDSHITWLREGDSSHANQQISQELALLLAAPTDVRPWQSVPLVIVDPMVRVQNVAQSVSKADLNRFVVECKRGVKVLQLGLGLTDLLLRASRVLRKPPLKPSHRKQQVVRALRALYKAKNPEPNMPKRKRKWKYWKPKSNTDRQSTT